MTVESAIRSAYFQALNPEIGYPVFNSYSVPEEQVYPYMIISQIDVNQIIISGCKKWRVNTTIDIITGFGSATGHTQANTIADLIENIINPDSAVQITVPAPYVIGDTRNVLSRNLEARNDNYFIYRNIRTYEHIVGRIG